MESGLDFSFFKLSIAGGHTIGGEASLVQGDHFEGTTNINLIQDENLTFQGHPGHSSDFANPGDWAGDHDPGHPVRLQLRVQAARPGERDEQGKLSNLPTFQRSGMVAKNS